MPKILVVDDSAFTRMKCAKILTEAGYLVIQAEDGVEAVEKYREYQPDGVLLDVVMPGMHGIAALQEIRKIDPVARVAILSAQGTRSIVKNAIKEGASNFIVKPFRETRVLDTVQRLLSNVKNNID